MATQPIDDHASFGVYDAKTNFASIVDRAFHGEVITITKHGKPIAQVRPIPVKVRSLDELIAGAEAVANSDWGGTNFNWRELIGRDEH